jgi:hypothetical protein
VAGALESASKTFCCETIAAWSIVDWLWWSWK